MAKKFYAKDGFVFDHNIGGAIIITPKQHDEGLSASVNGTGRIVVKNGVFSIGSARKITVYKKEDGSEISVYDDDVPDDCTTIPRPSEFHECVGDEWVITQQDAAEESAWNIISSQRDVILQSTQFRIAEDEPDRDLWLDYRAAVRAVMDQTDPFNITWPVPPNK